jgi:hypothetical protein
VGNGGSYSEIRRGEWGYVTQFGGKPKQMEGTILSVAYTAGLFDVSRAFVSSGLPERASIDRGWHGLSGWIKGLSRGKTRNRGGGWTE